MKPIRLSLFSFNLLNELQCVFLPSRSRSQSWFRHHDVKMITYLNKTRSTNSLGHKSFFYLKDDQ